MAISEVIVLPTCSICRDDEASDLSFRVTECGHAFHSECIKNWNHNQTNHNRDTTCPSCNTILCTRHFGKKPNLTRLHQLAKLKVTILAEGEHDPVETLKTATKKADQLEADKAKLTAENKNLETSINRLTQESKESTEELMRITQEVATLKRKIDHHAAELEKEKQLRKRQLHALYFGERKRLLRQLEDSKESYENLKEDDGLDPAELNANGGDAEVLAQQEQSARNISTGVSAVSTEVKRPRSSITANGKRRTAPSVIDIDSSESDEDHPSVSSHHPAPTKATTMSRHMPGPSAKKRLQAVPPVKPTPKKSLTIKPAPKPNYTTRSIAKRASTSSVKM